MPDSVFHTCGNLQGLPRYAIISSRSKHGRITQGNAHMTTTYQSLVTATTKAIRTVEAGRNVLKDTIAPLALAYFVTRATFDEKRAQYIEDAIKPILTSDEKNALGAVLPKKGSEEYTRLVAQDSTYVETHAAAQKARTAANKKLSGYADRIADYAWPEQVSEEDAAEAEAEKVRMKDPNYRALKAAQAAVKAAQGLESPPWNDEVLRHLLAAEALMALAMSAKRA